MPETWSLERFSDWFVGFHATPEARTRSRNAAARRALLDVADDLHHEWYLSIGTTVARLRSTGSPLPDWLASEEAAMRYALRALANDAIDLGRQRERSPVPHPFCATPEGEDDLLVRWASHDSGIDQTDVNAVLWAITGDLNRLLKGRAGGCPGCSSELVVRICLGVVARLRDPLTNCSKELARGGTNEWDKLIYDVIAQVAPERSDTTPDGRIGQRTRQTKHRCGRCVHRLLSELLALHLYGEGT
jgi:hypothetical protein